jgi:hypothetical protein
VRVLAIKSGIREAKKHGMELTKRKVRRGRQKSMKKLLCPKNYPGLYSFSDILINEAKITTITISVFSILKAIFMSIL